MRRLRIVSASDPGWRRARRGRGFAYLDQHGRPLAPEDRARVEALVIPPATDGTTIAAAVRRASPDPRQDQLDRATVHLLTD